MGKNKTKKKNHQRNHVPDDQDPDPDVSENEPSSSENASTSLNDTIVLSSGNNVMDTDVEDSEQTTGNSTPADGPDPITAGEPDGNPFTVNVYNYPADTSVEIVSEEASTNGKMDESKSQGHTLVKCPHLKNSAHTASVRKSLLKRREMKIICSAKPCTKHPPNVELQHGSGDNTRLHEPCNIWVCLQCGYFGCGDHTGLNGDAEVHYNTPKTGHHNLAVKLNDEVKTIWCFGCRTFVDVEDNAYVKETISLIKKSLDQKKQKQPAIALGPPPPPPQPQGESSEGTTEFRSARTNKSKMNGRNKFTSYGWENTHREEWPLGLDNLGNTCFMNSALQCLSRTKSLIPKLDMYGTGNTLEIMVTARPPSVNVLGTLTPETNGDASLFHLGSSADGNCIDYNGESNRIIPSAEAETGGSSPSSSDMDSLLDVASGTSSKSSPSKETAQENYKEEIEKELQRNLRLKLTISKDSMTSRLRTAFKAMSRSDGQKANNTHDENSLRLVRHVYTPSSIHNAMSKHFRPGQQHDSHELLRTVIDMMKKDQIKAFRLAIMQCYGVKKTEGKTCDPKIAELLKMWDRKLYHKTFVDEIFGGELVTFSKCLTCGSVRRSYEDFLDLSLPIRAYTRNQIPKRTYSVFDDDDSNGKRSLLDCLKSFTEPEQLTGSNAVECENCHRVNLEKLEAGARFEDVFPGVKLPVNTENEINKKKPVLEPEPQSALESEMDSTQPLLMDEETPHNGAEDMDDLDEPAVDGIIANTSDMEDEGNDVPPIFLGEYEDRGTGAATTTTTEFNHFNPSSLAGDEGFSESDSSEEKKSASISASSSRNSISEAENGMTTVQNKLKEVNKPIPITKCPCSRHQMVLRPPECLTVHLKRFQITSHGTSKLSDRVSFPYILNLTPFCARDDEDLQRLDGKDVYDEDGEVKYALYGIVEHSGSLHWGHYVAYIKVHGNQLDSAGENQVDTENSNDSSTEATPDQWFYISDSSVSPSTLDSVLRMDPYILFYERIRGTDKKNKATQLESLNDQNPPSLCNYDVGSTAAASFSTFKESLDRATTASCTATSETTTSNANATAGCSFDFSNFTGPTTSTE